MVTSLMDSWMISWLTSMRSTPMTAPPTGSRMALDRGKYIVHAVFLHADDITADGIADDHDVVRPRHRLLVPLPP